MNKFVLSSDSCCDIPQAEMESRGIYRLAMEYITEKDGVIVTARDSFSKDEEYLDFYEKLKQGVMIKTAQATLNEHVEYFEKILEKEQKDILHISLASGLSGTFEQATMAAKELEKRNLPYKVYVVDSLSLTAGQRLLVDEAEKLQHEGMTAAETKAKVESMCMNVTHWLIADDLKYLKRGGRISSVVALVGSILNIKPLCGVNYVGRPFVYTKNKGMKRSVASLIEIMKEYSDDLENQTVYVVDTNNSQTAKAVKDAIDENFKANTIMMRLGPVVGAHIGPGSVGIAMIGKKRPNAAPGLSLFK